MGCLGEVCVGWIKHTGALFVGARSLQDLGDSVLEDLDIHQVCSLKPALQDVGIRSIVMQSVAELLICFAFDLTFLGPSKSKVMALPHDAPAWFVLLPSYLAFNCFIVTTHVPGDRRGRPGGRQAINAARQLLDSLDHPST